MFKSEAHKYLYSTLIICAYVLITACGTATHLIDDLNEELTDADITAAEITVKIPNYSGDLVSTKGKTRAVISEPGNNDRVTIEFEADEIQSALTIKNRVGIEGGKIWVDKDSLLVYDITNKFAQKTAIKDGYSSIINDFASLNILDLLNYKIKADQIKQIKQSSKEYVVILKRNAVVRIDKKTFTIKKITEAPNAEMPYSTIEYDGYANLEHYALPRKIIIFSSNKEARISLQILNLTANPKNLNFEVKIPDNIIIERP